MSSMQIEADIRRSDIALLSLHLLPREKSNRIFVLMAGILMFAYLVVTKPPTTAVSFGVAIVASVSTGVALLLLGFVISLAYVTATASEKSGTLGRHLFSIDPDGIREVTSQNETLQKWAGIHKIGKSKRFIWLRITGYLFHIIPRRAFASDREFDDFWDLVCRYRQEAVRQVVAAPSDIRRE